MPKRATSPTAAPNSSPTKRARATPRVFNPNKIAQADNAAAVDDNPPLARLVKMPSTKTPREGESVVYWMRMGDLRISDNRALSLASEHAKREDIPLLVMFLFSPQDYIAHDRGARRIDFTLRNLRAIQTRLAELHIPLFTVTQPTRKEVPNEVIRVLDNVSATALYANIEYEVDELRRDIRICELAKRKNIATSFLHDKMVEPTRCTARIKKLWLTKLNANVLGFLQKSQDPEPNDESIRQSSRFGRLFESTVPDSIEGFELEDADKKKMDEIWPAGEEKAHEILQRFMLTKARAAQCHAVDPLASGAEETQKHSRLAKYDAERDHVDKDTTSRISPYLAAGVVSARACIRATLNSDRDPEQSLSAEIKVDGGRNTAVGRWVQEVAWRDFYVCILAGFPRVSMGRPFLEKYAGVVWENAPVENAYDGKKGKKPTKADMEKAEENIEKWKAGKTGVPIVDAGMRCLNEMGWMHNRLRMICAMYLTKDLMVDWRVGEKYFMENLIDGDLASNNGGWQWSASTGVDPCPYFRIFNPYTQSQKADPSGELIRHYVPELAKLRGTDLHNPPGATADKLGYPRALVKHDEARERALRRFKNPGTA
ncbi:Deoxyribodipyrimidine photo-lyase [Mycena chlorophos]|uniref:Deoxyribodipyrimidine photo-lyase n=1 Tax=Mycena chlorophos TaxID=658473 RepID=A0A8H6S3R7_MYCCL|nr:Deoxyribodipyrimidine photo-lyase [Mycena chlorophos]